jgi:predicted GNAT superfamily acetyltransferase
MSDVSGLEPAIQLRELTTADELAVLPEFERRVWGGEAEAVSVNMLVATLIEGGMALGAFDGDRVVGAVYGFATREPHVLHSHYMAVDPGYRRHGLAVRLKQAQRSWCLDHGYTTMRWTYDPLQVANAHLNLRVLGAVGVTYHTNHYGELGGINGSLPSDRVTVRWDLDLHARPLSAESRSVTVPELAPDAISSSAREAHTARHIVREALLPLMEDGWCLVDMERTERRYTLSRPA